MNKLVLVALASSLVSGCAILGRQQVDQSISEEAVAEIKPGMSRSRVTEIMGAPQEIKFSNKAHDPLREHAYIYTHEKTVYTGILLAILTFGNSDTKKDRVVVFLDDQGNVSHVGASLHANNASYGFPFGG